MGYTRICCREAHGKSPKFEPLIVLTAQAATNKVIANGKDELILIEVISPRMEQTSNKWLILGIYAALTLATITAYEPLRHNDFVSYDDDAYITKNPMVKAGLTRQSVAWAFTTLDVGNWHPLTWLSHMLDCQLFGVEPFWHHLVNLLFHTVNTLLLFWLLKKMTAAFWPSAFVAAVFALHPLHVESVAWVAERKDLLSTFFWILAVAAYVRYTKHPNISRYLLVFLTFGLGLMAKPMVVTLPFVLLLLDYWPLDRFRWKQQNIRRLIVEKIPLFVLVAASCVITFVAQQNIGATKTFKGVPVSIAIKNAFVSYLGYIDKMVYPKHLAVLYPHPASNLSTGQALIPFAILVAVTVYIIYTAKQRRYLAVGWFWYLGTLVPVIGFVQVGLQAMADRYTYLPSIGFFIMVAFGAAELSATRRFRNKSLAITAAIVLTILLFCTRVQLRHWQNSFALFTHTLKVTENNFAMHQHLGSELYTMGRTNEAIKHFDRALEINPKYHKARNNKGVMLFTLGRFEEAAVCFNKILELKPDFHEAHSNLGMALYKLDSTDEAIKHWKQAIQLNPTDLRLYFNLGSAFTKKNQLDEAAAYFNKAWRMKPDWPEVHYNLGLVYYRQGKLHLAAEHSAHALRLKPDYIEAAITLARSLLGLGQIHSAVGNYHKILQLAPDRVEVLNDLAWILAVTKDTDVHNPTDAVKFARRACELTNYQQPEKLDTLAVAYAAAGNFTEALKTAEKAAQLAESTGKKDLVRQINSRIQLYKADKPYNE
ncbi:MAG: tetratricopeptide repeat protein [Planctomycetota bacterium]